MVIIHQQTTANISATSVGWPNNFKNGDTNRYKGKIRMQHMKTVGWPNSFKNGDANRYKGKIRMQHMKTFQS